VPDPVSAVPEPATLSLLAIGVRGLIATKRHCANGRLVTHSRRSAREVDVAFTGAV
jgi:hypothetical protein